MKANKFLQSDKGTTNLVPIVMAIVITFALLYVGTYVTGMLNSKAREAWDDTSGHTDSNRTFNRLNNTSDNWDDALDIVQVTIIITILASAIGAIFMFTRFR